MFQNDAQSSTGLHSVSPRNAAVSPAHASGTSATWPQPSGLVEFRVGPSACRRDHVRKRDADGASRIMADSSVWAYHGVILHAALHCHLAELRRGVLGLILGKNSKP
jgi:hypothetical protein